MEHFRYILSLQFLDSVISNKNVWWLKVMPWLFSCQYADVSIKLPAAVYIGLLAHFHSSSTTLSAFQIVSNRSVIWSTPRAGQYQWKLINQTQLRSSINCPNKIEIFYRLVNGFENCFMLYSFLNVFIIYANNKEHERKK